MQKSKKVQSIKKPKEVETARLLTSEEIKDILSYITPNPYIPKDIAKEICEREVQRQTKQLKNVKLYPKLIPHLKYSLAKTFFSSLIQPGESVGILTAQSIGEKQTQANLNTFHRAGSSDKQPVTSKFGELLNGTKEPKVPMSIAYFKYGNSTIPELRKTIGSTIVHLNFQKITKNYKINSNKQPEPWYDSFLVMKNKELNYTDCITLYVNMDILFMYKVTLEEIANIINDKYEDMYCIYSPDCFGQLDIFADTTEINLPEDQVNLITPDQVKEIYMDDVVYPNIMKTDICGIPGVESMYFIRDGNNQNTWALELENTRSKLPESVLRYKKLLAHPAIDMSRTVTNNVWVIYQTLGIQAARAYMIREFSSIMEGINLCHVILLVNKMTSNGTISSISRYTMRHDECGPFGKASNEETTDNFIEAGIYGSDESTKGVSASIICGKRAQIGTGLCKLKMDLQAIKE